MDLSATIVELCEAASLPDAAVEFAEEGVQSEQHITISSEMPYTFPDWACWVDRTSDSLLPRYARCQSFLRRLLRAEYCVPKEWGREKVKL